MTLIQMNTGLFYRFVLFWILLAFVTFVLLFFFSAPYGRYHRQGWGPAMGRQVGWFAMEIPALVVFFFCFFLWRDQTTPATVMLLLVWGLHYGHRALIYIEEYAIAHDLRAGDAIVAATAVENNLTLVSGNSKHFKPIRELQLRVFSP